MRHIRQSYPVSCGAAAMAMVAGISEDKAISLCKTDKTGTSMINITAALNDLRLQPHFVLLENIDFKECWWLEHNMYPIIVSGFFKTKYFKKGRPRERHHAFVINRGQIHDPAENQPYPFEAYSHVFDDLFIKSIIIVENA